MSEAADVDLNHRPSLVDFVRLQYDQARQRWVLQAPERVLVLDETGREIVERCDGTRTVADIVGALAQEYDAPRDVIEHDVVAVLRLLTEKTFMVMEP